MVRRIRRRKLGTSVSFVPDLDDVLGSVSAYCSRGFGKYFSMLHHVQIYVGMNLIGANRTHNFLVLSPFGVSLSLNEEISWSLLRVDSLLPRFL